MDTIFKASNPDDEERERIARLILAAMEAAGFSAELGVADDADNAVVPSPSITTMDN